MPALPSGDVTMLFTDIEGSTRMLAELGDAYADALGEHRRLLRKAFADHGGIEVDTQGDAFFVAFPDAGRAVDAAIDAHRLSPRGSGEDLADGGADHLLLALLDVAEHVAQEVPAQRYQGTPAHGREP